MHSVRYANHPRLSQVATSVVWRRSGAPKRMYVPHLEITGSRFVNYTTTNKLMRTNRGRVAELTRKHTVQLFIANSH